MALIQNLPCGPCHKYTDHINGKCGECSKKEAAWKRKVHFTNLDIMTLEERIRRLEEIEYNQSINPPWIEPTY